MPDDHRTPGPWEVHFGVCSGTATIHPNDGHGSIAIVRLRPSKTNNTAETRANACLIAAAPTMLEALRANLSATAGYVGPGHVEAYNKTRQAIEAATGEECRPEDPPEAVAFRNLSATAPDLLAMLETCVQRLSSLEGTADPDGLSAQQMGRSAIAKARGLTMALCAKDLKALAAQARDNPKVA